MYSGDEVTYITVRRYYWWSSKQDRSMSQHPSYRPKTVTSDGKSMPFSQTTLTPEHGTQWDDIQLVCSADVTEPRLASHDLLLPAAPEPEGGRG